MPAFCHQNMPLGPGPASLLPLILHASHGGGGGAGGEAAGLGFQQEGVEPACAGLRGYDSARKGGGFARWGSQIKSEQRCCVEKRLELLWGALKG